jgi:hypothetical protein
MGLRDQTQSQSRAHAAWSETQLSQQTRWAPSLGTYLTDGFALFRVHDVLAGRGELFLELEDCYTLDLVLCPASKAGGPALRRVAPVGS